MRVSIILASVVLLVALPLTAEGGKPTPSVIYTERIWGDIECNGNIDAGDVLPVLQWVSGQQDITPPLPTGCPSVFHGVAAQGYEGTWRWGDVDCSSQIEPVDLIVILHAAVSLPAIPIDGCPPVATSVPVTIVGK